MTTQQNIFSYVISVLEDLNIPYMIGGSVAAIAYGKPRLTLDMDIVINLNPNQAQKLVARFNKEEYYADLNMILNAIETKGHFNIINSKTAVKIDFYVLANDAFSQAQFARKTKEAFTESQVASFAAPEDVILKKLEWYKMGESQKHLDDINGIIKVSGSKLDYNYLKMWAHKLNVSEILNKLLPKESK